MYIDANKDNRIAVEVVLIVTTSGVGDLDTLTVQIFTYRVQRDVDD